MAHHQLTSTYSRRNASLALFTFALAFVVILLGAYTRLTNAGLSCPDWPNCYGYLTAPHTMSQLQDAAERYPLSPVDITKAWTEMTHRYFAGTEGVLILILAVSVLRKRQSRFFIIGTALIALLCSQVLLGMLTVTEKLKPIIVLGHLLTGLSLLSVLWWTYLTLNKNSALQGRASFSSSSLRGALFATKQSRMALWLGLLIIILQITLGGWVSTHYAGLACIDFPYCNGQLLPEMQWQHLNSDLITIHMLHRIGAAITASYFILLAWYLLRTSRLKLTAILLLALITLQITLGILNIVWLRPVWIALIHHTVAIFLLLTMIRALVISQEVHHAA